MFSGSRRCDMSRQRYRWWRYVRRIIRDYPSLKQAWNDLHSQSLTADMSGMPKSGSAGRTVEQIALRQLPPDDQKDYDAVTQAIKITQLLKDGKERLALIHYVYWYPKEHTVKDAAPRTHISEATAKRWHGEFVKLVGKCRGFHVDDTSVHS